MSKQETMNNNGEQYLRDLTKSFKGLKKPLPNEKSPATMDELIAELHQVFSSDRVDIEYVNHLLFTYQSTANDWQKYVKFDESKYTRNLIDAGNGKFNLLLICWGAGQGSAIHDHTESHCFMRMLKGQLKETRYDWPNDDSNNNIDIVNSRNAGNVENNNVTNIKDLFKPEPDDGHDKEYDSNGLQELSSAIMKTDSVHYINDTLGLHRVENPSPEEGAISLHLYCPPYYHCSVFDQKTGEQTIFTIRL